MGAAADPARGRTARERQRVFADIPHRPVVAPEGEGQNARAWNRTRAPRRVAAAARRGARAPLRPAAGASRFRQDHRPGRLQPQPEGRGPGRRLDLARRGRCPERLRRLSGMRVRARRARPVRTGRRRRLALVARGLPGRHAGQRHRGARGAVPARARRSRPAAGRDRRAGPAAGRAGARQPPLCAGVPFQPGPRPVDTGPRTVRALSSAADELRFSRSEIEQFFGGALSRRQLAAARRADRRLAGRADGLAQPAGCR